MADTQVLAYLKAYRDYKQAEQRAFELVERVQRGAGQLRQWKEAGGRGPFAAELREWPAPSEVKTASDALTATAQTMQRCWGSLGDAERGGLQPPFA